ncbi:Riboflavin synthase alpha chain, partial [Coemansia sp. RSA 2559]
GFVAIDGTSLTVCDVNDAEGWFTIMLVAYTQAHVVFPQKKEGDAVNIEVDMLGKYVEKVTASLLGAATDDGTAAPSTYIESIVKRVLDKSKPS